MSFLAGKLLEAGTSLYNVGKGAVDGLVDAGKGVIHKAFKSKTPPYGLLIKESTLKFKYDSIQAIHQIALYLFFSGLDESLHKKGEKRLDKFRFDCDALRVQPHSSSQGVDRLDQGREDLMNLFEDVIWPALKMDPPALIPYASKKVELPVPLLPPKEDKIHPSDPQADSALTHKAKKKNKEHANQPETKSEKPMAFTLIEENKTFPTDAFSSSQGLQVQISPDYLADEKIKRQTENVNLRKKILSLSRSTRIWYTVLMALNALKRVYGWGEDRLPSLDEREYWDPVTIIYHKENNKLDTEVSNAVSLCFYRIKECLLEQRDKGPLDLKKFPLSARQLINQSLYEPKKLNEADEKFIQTLWLNYGNLQEDQVQTTLNQAEKFFSPLGLEYRQKLNSILE